VSMLFLSLYTMAVCMYKLNCKWNASFGTVGTMISCTLNARSRDLDLSAGDSSLALSVGDTLKRCLLLQCKCKYKSKFKI